jgi:predicted O-methyltransferase YrrM
VGSVDFTTAAAVLDGIPNMTRERAHRVYDHLIATESRDVLELGTAHGVSASYMAAAVQSRGGRVTTVDHVVATRQRDPQPDEVISRCGLADHVELVLVEDSSYTWWLGDQITANTSDGVCRPIYDFVFIDGAHNWTIDGLSFFLVEKLLRPGGWLLLDDLAWFHDAPESSFGPGQGPDALGLSAAERAQPHMRLVFDRLIVPHSGFSNFRVEDEDWAWAQKSPDGRHSVERVKTVARTRRARAALRRLLARD